MIHNAMEMLALISLLSLVLGSLTGPSALPMTDYSQLNHDEPTHWTKAATTKWTPVSTSPTTVTTIAHVTTTNDSSLNSTLDDLATTVGFLEEANDTATQHVNATSTTHRRPTVAPEDTYDESGDDRTSNNEHYYRYDLVDDGKRVYPGENDIPDKLDVSDDLDKVVLRKPELVYDRSPIGTKYDYNNPDNFDSDQEEEVIRKDDDRVRAVYESEVIPTLADINESYDADTPFKKWDRDSEEQEKLLEDIVIQANNDTTLDNIEMGSPDSGSIDEQTGTGRWFLLLLAGNSTIVRLRQKDFAKYLKLNLAARLSLEYDEIRLNKVILAPPRLMVNVSVVPTGLGNLDEEFDLNERLFGEEEAPLHKLAETNATLLELSGEEYHVVRFLSLRSQQPFVMEEGTSETSAVVNDRHADIEKVVFFGLGAVCLFLLIPLVFALCRLYLVPLKVRWPWKRDKNIPLFKPWAPRQRLHESTASSPNLAGTGSGGSGGRGPPPITGPLTVIYSGSFVERNGPPSGSWIEAVDDVGGSTMVAGGPTSSVDNPIYGFGALERNSLCDPSVLDSPRFTIDSKLRILGCRPSHLLIPHTPVKRAPAGRSTDSIAGGGKNNLDVRITQGLDNPNYET